jgi:thiamine pyrophosphokinase
MSHNSKRILLFANGPMSHPEVIRSFIQAKDKLIAVDGGLRHLLRLGLAPDLIIGDLDSADPEQIQKFKDQAVEIRQYPEEKDQTDLELAVFAALDMQPSQIRIFGALGGRIDQTLANILLLTKPDLASTDIRLIAADQEVFLIRNTAQIDGSAGQRVSLLPLHGPVKGIRTRGLKYPLKDENLYPDQTRGISNMMGAGSAFIEIQQGLLLCIHEFSKISPERRD